MTRTDSDPKAHWDDVYRHKGPQNVSWFQPNLRTSLALIDAMGLPPTASIVDVGGGASTLVDDLLARGFIDVTVLDLSGAALEASRRRLGARASRVTWLEADITTAALPPARYDLWHDRAVFHFLTDPEARRRYIEAAERAIKPGGHIVVATFAPEGPEKCSGLDVVRYDAGTLHQAFGQPFEPVSHLEESHRTPWGTSQAFVYCYCRRASPR